LHRLAEEGISIPNSSLAAGKDARVSVHLAKEKLMQTEIIGSRPRAALEATSRSAALLGALFAGFLGGFLIWGVGFSHIDVVHNATHDARHSSGFPCH
jgi:cobalt transporter subunit CbtB